MRRNRYVNLVLPIREADANSSRSQVLPLIITDITFIDERGFFFGCYWGAQNLINTIFTITCSYLVADMGWR